jgi:hypothetical protein
LAVIGKQRAKDWLRRDRARLNDHWSSKFDAALQSCQSRETFGIPVGPDTSRIVAEILLAGVESDGRFAESIKGMKAYRLLDDFVIGFDDELLAKKALAALRSALWTFNLQLNDDKSSVAHARTHFRDKWQLEFDSIAILDRDTPKQAGDIYRLIDLTLYFCAEAKTAAPAHWACRRLSSLKNVTKNLGVVLDVMFRLARDFPSCTNHVAAFLINHQIECSSADLTKRISIWVKSMFREHLHHNHDFELAWCLLVNGVFRIAVDKDDLGTSGERPHSVVFAMLGMLQERGMLPVTLSNWDWRPDFKKGGILGKDWLPYYEAVRRKWTTDKTMVSAVRSQPVLAKMLDNGVTFLEDRIFDASRINIKRRVFASAKAGSRRKVTLQPPPKSAAIWHFDYE